MSRRIGIILTLLAFVIAAPGHANATAEVPTSKQTVLKKYFSAKEAFDEVTSNRSKVLFVDVRTSAELMFVGATGEIDTHVPFVEMVYPATWDAAKNRFKLAPNTSFVANVDAALSQKGLSKSDMVIVMCRSGDRSAKSVNALAAAGYTNVYSVYDGFEGDASKEGRRTINGWKNAGLPWSYKLDGAKIPAAHTTAK
ncbi:Rhodanese-related sulfurtransferase [Filomicrobium insigne]|uniref:Rhodanese-related sulfurtransferase n=1 Tax=Filomicrobium insigne TaxID=418854 RepID=A0A1H0JLE3_9HYPH|nr:rhodanese-like domain-containing protein [Filomicrobium insigne]SDO44434.1 Rhodanese-related sulfurtransferase [Filomicrobium insigne]